MTRELPQTGECVPLDPVQEALVRLCVDLIAKRVRARLLEEQRQREDVSSEQPQTPSPSDAARA